MRAHREETDCSIAYLRIFTFHADDEYISVLRYIFDNSCSWIFFQGINSFTSTVALLLPPT